MAQPPEPSLRGVSEKNRPLCPELRGDLPFWQMMALVNAQLKRCGMPVAAQEFRHLAYQECDGDTGMLFTLALNYVRLDLDGEE